MLAGVALITLQAIVVGVVMEVTLATPADTTGAIAVLVRVLAVGAREGRVDWDCFERGLDGVWIMDGMC